MKTTFKQVRAEFFNTHKEFKNEFRTRKTHNEYTTNCRCAFNDFTDSLHRNGMLTDSQVQRITL